MSARPWMPFYVADYRAKTAHLSALQHGVYLLLIMHYWSTGGLPDDDEQLARIACLSATEWRKNKPTIERFFSPGWKHGRIDEELAKTAEISGKRRAAAEQMHINRDANAGANAGANAVQMQTQPQPQPQSLKKELNGVSGGVGLKGGYKPPPHGARGKGRIWISAASQDWAAYAEDYKQAHGEYPRPNEHGGKWFKILGESAAI